MSTPAPAPRARTFRPVDVARYTELGFLELEGTTLIARRASGTLPFELSRSTVVVDGGVLTITGRGQSGVRLDASEWVDGDELLDAVRRAAGHGVVSRRSSGGSGVARSQTVWTIAAIVGLVLAAVFFVLSMAEVIPLQRLSHVLGVGAIVVALVQRYLHRRGRAGDDDESGQSSSS